jgi:hypothetical protein
MDQKRRRIKITLTVVALYAVLTACASLTSFVRNIKPDPSPNRGVNARHEFHATQGLECADCHTPSEDLPMSIASHDLCSVCHEIPEDSLTNSLAYKDEVSCKTCHTRKDFSILPRQQFVTAEIKFQHQVHLNAEVSCTECHDNPDKPMNPNNSPMAKCMDCHEKSGTTFASIAQSSTPAHEFLSNKCSVCHRELNADTIPEFRHGQRIAHDNKQAWMHLHGQESYVDTQYCAQCHVEQQDCTTCHQIMKPDSHTLAWNRRLHGTHAQWDSQSCAACHEEDSCIKCHQHTQPMSHSSNFFAPRNNHCTQCHFPPESSCIVCHQNIEHPSAPRTPHDADGGFAGDCAQCHPGGRPGAVPHRNNLATNCLTCHQ